MKNKPFDKALELSGFDASLHKEKIHPSTRDFLNKYGVSTELIQFFTDFSFDQSVQIGNIYFDRVNDFEEHNLDEMSINCIETDLLIIGSGLNGDPIIVDLKNLHVGFVFHDELWDDEETVFAREILVDMNCGIEDFYLNAVQIENHPVDAYQAEEYINQDG